MLNIYKHILNSFLIIIIAAGLNYFGDLIKVNFLDIKRYDYWQWSYLVQTTIFDRLRWAIVYCTLFLAAFHTLNLLFNRNNRHILIHLIGLFSFLLITFYYLIIPKSWAGNSSIIISPSAAVDLAVMVIVSTIYSKLYERTMQTKDTVK